MCFEIEFDESDRKHDFSKDFELLYIRLEFGSTRTVSRVWIHIASGVAPIPRTPRHTPHYAAETKGENSDE